MVTTGACMRCHSLSTSLSGGTMLRLCPACALLPACGEYRHTFRAGDSVGTWVCLSCGSVLASQPIATAGVAASTPVPDY